MGRKAKLMVIGLDGATWDLIKPWAENGELPTFKYLMENGSWGILESTIPPMTPPGWTSMVTGVNPGKHGVYDFFYYQDGSLKLVTSKRIKSPRVWQILDRYGYKSLVLNVPILFPPDKINGVFVSGMLTPGLDSEFAHPKDLKEYLLRKGYTIEADPEEWVAEIRKKIHKNKKEVLGSIVEKYNDEVRVKKEITLELLEKENPDFVFIVFESTDRLQHYFWDDEGLRHVLNHYKFLDSVIGELITAGENVMIVSDHGFSQIKKVFYVNSWLYHRGYLKLKISLWRFKVKYKVFKLGKRLLGLAYRLNLPVDRIVKTTNVSGVSGIDLDASQAYCLTYTSMGIFIGNVKNKEELKDRIVRELNSLKDPQTGKSFLKAFKKEELYHGDELESAPDIVLLMEKGYTLSNVLIPPDEKLIRNSFLLFPSEGLSFKNGDHSIDGIVLLYGKYFKKNAKIQTKIWDVTPTILYLFDVPLSSYLDGRVITEGIVPEILERKKIKRGDLVNIKKIARKLKPGGGDK